MNRFASSVMRLVSVEKVDYNSGVVYTKWLDQAGLDGPIVSIPHPYAGSHGEGIYIGISTGSILILGMTANEQYVALATLPPSNNFGNLNDISESSFDDIATPTLDSGDIIIQNKNGAEIKLNNYGDINLYNSFHEGVIYGGDSDNSIRCSIVTSSPVEYTISSAGIKAMGLIRRDIRIEEGEEDYVDFLYDLSSEQALEEVGWDISKKTSYLTRNPNETGTDTADDKRFRNPGLIENRTLLYEYGKEWDVKNFGVELDRFNKGNQPLIDFSDRRQRRSNVLSLSQTNPNELIEHIEGTLVDIFGNMLDINKSILPKPEGTNPSDLKDIFEVNRHSVVVHKEINTKKGYAYREGSSNTRKPVLIGDGIPSASVVANNAKDRSRWSLRVDKEGLTSINIPATSETGNIPFLTRQETTSVINIDDKGKITDGDRADYDGLYRNDKNQDIFHDQVGPGGISVAGPTNTLIPNRLKGKLTSWVDTNDAKEKKQQKLPDFIEAGTAFHSITQTAQSILDYYINFRAADIFEPLEVAPSPQAISNQINAKVPIPGDFIADRDPITGLIVDHPNAGGRSVQINLDGSLETSIGANTVDRVSWVLDTAGAIVARLGRDRQGRSAIIQADGYVAIEIGGFDFIGEAPNDEVDTRFVGRGESRKDTLPGDKKQYKGGKLVIRLRRSNTEQTGPDEDDNLLIIDDSGITIKTAGRFNIVSGQDIVLTSNSRIAFEAPIIQNYKNNPKFVLRDGRRL
jgi:hypothetical protein